MLVSVPTDRALDDPGNAEGDDRQDAFVERSARSGGRGSEAAQIDAKAQIERLHLLLKTIQRATYGKT